MNNLNSIIVSLAVILGTACGAQAQEDKTGVEAQPPAGAKPPADGSAAEPQVEERTPAKAQAPADDRTAGRSAQAPQSASAPANEPDNTARNRTSEPTAENQSNQKASVDRVAKIRRAIVGRKGLSIDAKNVKIVDENGTVHLRGPVDNPHEKQIIERLARQYAGAGIKNELEVRSTR